MGQPALFTQGPRQKWAEVGGLPRDEQALSRPAAPDPRIAKRRADQVGGPRGVRRAARTEPAFAREEVSGQPPAVAQAVAAVVISCERAQQRRAVPAEGTLVYAGQLAQVRCGRADS